MEIPRPPDWGGGGEFHMALGTYEQTELAYVLSRLHPGDTFLDLGAHIGYFTLPVAKRVLDHVAMSSQRSPSIDWPHSFAATSPSMGSRTSLCLRLQRQNTTAMQCSR